MDDMKCTVYKDDAGNVLAELCGSGNVEFSFDPDYSDPMGNTSPEWSDDYVISPFDSMVVDKPWYQDVWDKLGWIHQPIESAWNTVPAFQLGLIILGITALIGFALWFGRRAVENDLAPDAYDVEDYMDNLNESADERNYAPHDDYAYDGEYDPR